VHALAWGPEGKTLALGRADGAVLLVDSLTWKKRSLLPAHTNEVHSVAFSSDGKKLATGANEETVKVWDVATGKILHTLKGRRVAFHPDGKTLATVLSPENTVKLWDASTGKELRTLSGPTAELRRLAFHPDGRMLVACGADNAVFCWDLTGSSPVVRTLAFGGRGVVECVAFTPEGRHVIAGHRHGIVSVLRLALPGPKTRGEPPRVAKPHKIPILNPIRGGWQWLAFSTDSRTLAMADHPHVTLWDVATGRKRKDLGGQGASSVAYSPDGKLFFAPCPDHENGALANLISPVAGDGRRESPRGQRVLDQHQFPKKRNEVSPP
jgi:WD40 repeat protein